jgi:hypothetical protein
MGTSLSHFEVHEGIMLKSIYLMTPKALEYYYDKWNTKWHAAGGKNINNPKIPLKCVIDKGQLIYSACTKIIKAAYPLVRITLP